MTAVMFPQYPNQRDLGGRDRVLLSDYADVYDGSYAHGDDRMYLLRARTGFVHDGASVPPAVWSIYPPHPLDVAAVHHDLTYRRAGIMLPGEWMVRVGDEWKEVGRKMPRSESDRLFRYQIRRDPREVSRWRKRVAYRLVRGWGWRTWSRYEAAL